MRHSTFKIALVLGLVTAIGPLAIDMYLPALPGIGTALQAEPNMVQLSLTLFAVGLGLGQVFFGSLSDLIGRTRPLYGGILIFFVCSIGCAITHDINAFLLFRLIAGFGASAGIVIGRAIVRDLATGAEAAKLMAAIMLVFSVSPILAPPIGNILSSLFDWRVIFWVTGTLGALSIVLVKLNLEETHTRQSITAAHLRSTITSYRTVFSDRSFVTCLMATSCGVASFFTFITTSPFVFIEKFHFTTTQYSLFFPVIAAAFIGATQLVGKLAAKHGLDKVLYLGSIAFAVLSSTGAVLTFAFNLPLAGQMLFLVVSYGCMGLVSPSAVILAMKPHPNIAGASSAAIGMMQFVFSGVFVSVLSALPITPHQLMFFGMALGSAISCVLVVSNRRYLDKESPLFK